VVCALLQEPDNGIVSRECRQGEDQRSALRQGEHKCKTERCAYIFRRCARTRDKSFKWRHTARTGKRSSITVRGLDPTTGTSRCQYRAVNDTRSGCWAADEAGPARDLGAQRPRQRRLSFSMHTKGLLCLWRSATRLVRSPIRGFILEETQVRRHDLRCHRSLH